MKKNYKKGFTLIELLVVIAIIGILSSIVLASLSSARSKGEDAAIQSTLSNMRAQAELYYSTNNDYGITASTCSTGIFGSTATGGLKALVDSAKTRSATVNCYATASTSWAVSALLKSSTQHFCVDNTGVAKATSSTIGSSSCGF